MRQHENGPTSSSVPKGLLLPPLEEETTRTTRARRRTTRDRQPPPQWATNHRQQQQQGDGTTTLRGATPSLESIYRELEAERSSGNLAKHIFPTDGDEEGVVLQSLTTAAAGAVHEHHRASPRSLSSLKLTTTIPTPYSTYRKPNYMQSAYVYSGPLGAETALGYSKEQTTSASGHYPTNHHQHAQSRSMDDTNSVATGLSQQELIRKKVRSRKDRKTNSHHNRRRKPVIRLPTSLLAPLQKSQNHRGKADTKEERASSRSKWKLIGTVKLQEEVSTAETTKASGEEATPPTSPNAEGPISDVKSNDGSSTMQFLETSNRVHPRVTVRGDDTLLIESRLNQSTETSIDQKEGGLYPFPVLSEKATSYDDDISWAADSNDYYRQQQPPKHNSSNQTMSSTVDSSSTAPSSPVLREKGVRFAETIDDGGGGAGDGDSSVPWDQRMDMKQQSWPASSMGTIPEATTTYPHTSKPRSILREPRFKPSSVGVHRCVDGSELGILDAARARQLHLNPDGSLRNSKYVESEISSMEAPSERGLFASEKHAAANSYLSRGQRLEGSWSSQESSSTEERMLPPRNDEGSELSSIQPNYLLDEFALPSVTADSEPISHIAGHPAEKHSFEIGVSTKIDQRSGNEMTHREQLEREVDDEGTDISVNAFIETVAAIVIQTECRRYLAGLHALGLLRARDAEHRKAHTDANRRAKTIPAAREAPNKRSVKVGYVAHQSEDPDESSYGHEPSRDDVFGEEGELSGKVTTANENDGASALESKLSVAEGANKDLEYVAFDMYELAAMQIQALFRGYWVRDCLDVDHYCATSIQTHCRGFMCRTSYLQTMWSIITVQSWWRRNIARDEAANLLASAIAIQALARRYLVRRLYLAYRPGEVRAKHQAAITIQSQWRGFVCETNFFRALVDVLIAQTIVRRWLAQRRVKQIRTAVRRTGGFPHEHKAFINFAQPKSSLKSQHAETSADRPEERRRSGRSDESSKKKVIEYQAKQKATEERESHQRSQANGFTGLRPISKETGRYSESKRSPPRHPKASQGSRTDPPLERKSSSDPPGDFLLRLSASSTTLGSGQGVKNASAASPNHSRGCGPNSNPGSLERGSEDHRVTTLKTARQDVNGKKTSPGKHFNPRLQAVPSHGRSTRSRRVATYFDGPIEGDKRVPDSGRGKYQEAITAHSTDNSMIHKADQRRSQEYARSKALFDADEKGRSGSANPTPKRVVAYPEDNDDKISHEKVSKASVPSSTELAPKAETVKSDLDFVEDIEVTIDEAPILSDPAQSRKTSSILSMWKERERQSALASGKHL